MKTDYAAMYKALELAPGATPEEVKRAYFRLLRQYRPETHPEEFKRIRQAYEALKDGTPEIEEPAFPPPTDPILQMPLEMASASFKAGDYEEASVAYDGLMRIMPDDPFILLSLANAQRLAGHPQKAAKTALHMTELYPDNREAWRIAATQTYSRGWYKKALPMFRKAYSLGEKHLDFLTDYASAARDNMQLDECDQMCREILKTEKWNKDNVEYAAEAYVLLAHRVRNRKEAIELLDSYTAFLPGCRRLPLDTESLSIIVAAVFYGAEKLMEDFQVYQKADQCLALIMKMRSADNSSMPGVLRSKLTLEMSRSDKRFHSTAWPGLAETSFMVDKDFPFFEASQEEKDFAVVDTQLCLLKEDPDEFRQDAALLERDYPHLYEQNRDFIAAVLNGERDALFFRLKKQFLKMYYKFTGSNFLQLYPEEAPPQVQATKIHDDMKPFTRSGKKVGRNDPCPCGSGKKFKRCCQGKGIYD